MKKDIIPGFYYKPNNKFFKIGDTVKITTVNLLKERKNYIGKISDIIGNNEIILDCSNKFESNLITLRNGFGKFIVNVEEIKNENVKNIY